MDQCLHLWRYTGGFEKIDQAKEDLWNDPVRTYRFCSFNHLAELVKVYEAFERLNYVYLNDNFK